MWACASRSGWPLPSRVFWLACRLKPSPRSNAPSRLHRASPPHHRGRSRAAGPPRRPHAAGGGGGADAWREPPAGRARRGQARGEGGFVGVCCSVAAKWPRRGPRAPACAAALCGSWKACSRPDTRSNVTVRRRLGSKPPRAAPIRSATPAGRRSGASSTRKRLRRSSNVVTLALPPFRANHASPLSHKAALLGYAPAGSDGLWRTADRGGDWE